MTKEQAKKPARKKRGPIRKREETVYYVFEIMEWDWSFMFGANKISDGYGPYSDYRHLHLKGKILRPMKMRVEKAELVFLPERRLNEGQRERDILSELAH